MACVKVELTRQNRKAGATLFAMNKITQTARYRQSLILYAQKNGVTKAAIHYRTNRQYIYRWKKRYDGTLQSLEDRSHRPRNHPKQHQPEEIKLIDDMRRRNPKYMAKPYLQAEYPGQKVQIDVKYVPQSCLVGAAAEEAKENSGYFYQYTFIDEYSRFRYLEAFQEHNTFSSSEFIRHCVKRFPYAIECVQTDNGPEFTNRLRALGSDRKTLFEKTLEQLGIQHKLIKPYTPRHNGKVERSHRKDNEYFYALHKFYSFDDFQAQLALWNRKYNDFPMRPLNWISPKQALSSFPDSVTHH